MAKNIFYSLMLIVLFASCIREDVPNNRQFVVEEGQNVTNLLDFDMDIFGGETVNIANYLGRVILIQFTTWDCRMSFSQMLHIEQQIWRKHKDNPEFALFGIARREENTPERVADLINRTGVTYPIVMDPTQYIFTRFAERNGGATRAILINKDGTIVKLTRYFSRDGWVEFNELVARIDALLADD